MDEQAYIELVDAAFDRPWDDGLRHHLDVAGDWLEEQGDPRGAVLAHARALDRDGLAARRLTEVLLGDGRSLVAGAEALVRRGAVRGRWVGSYLRELTVDARSLGEAAAHRETAFVEGLVALLRTEICRRGLRRLRVRAVDAYAPRWTAQALALAPVHHASLRMAWISEGEPQRVGGPCRRLLYARMPRLHTVVESEAMAPLPPTSMLRGLWDASRRDGTLAEIARDGIVDALAGLEVMLAPGLFPEPPQVAALRTIEALGEAASLALPRLRGLARDAQYAPLVQREALRIADAVSERRSARRASR